MRRSLEWRCPLPAATADHPGQFAEITGLEYDFAVEVLRSAGFLVPGRGATGRLVSVAGWSSR